MADDTQEQGIERRRKKGDAVGDEPVDTSLLKAQVEAMQAQLAVADKRITALIEACAHLEAQCFCLTSQLGWRDNARPAPEGLKWVSGLSKGTYESVQKLAVARLLASMPQ